MQANEEASAVPLQEITKQLYEAASSDPWRPGPHPMTKKIPISLTSNFHSAQVQRSLDRAGRKSFVRAIKPLRRLLRNQGAVNDSLIEALFHLSALTQQMIEEIGELQGRLSALEAQIRQVQPEQRGANTTPVAE